MKRIALCIAATLLSLSAICKPAENGAVPGEWTMDFESARKVAIDKGLPIFINFTGSDWCVWCKHMEKEVFSTKEWRDYAKTSLMLVWIDFPKDEALVPEKYRLRNQQLAATFEIEGYPAYIILDDNGRDELGTLQAEQQITPQGFISKLKPILLERDAATRAMIASMPKLEGAELKKACDERTVIRKALTDLHDKERQLGTKLAELEDEITTLRIKALVDKLEPAKASKYRSTQKELTAAERELQDWIESKPAQNEENQKKFDAMSQKISDLDSKATELLF